MFRVFYYFLGSPNAAPLLRCCHLYSEVLQQPSQSKNSTKNSWGQFHLDAWVQPCEEYGQSPVIKRVEKFKNY